MADFAITIQLSSSMLSNTEYQPRWSRQVRVYLQANWWPRATMLP